MPGTQERKDPDPSTRGAHGLVEETPSYLEDGWGSGKGWAEATKEVPLGSEDTILSLSLMT